MFAGMWAKITAFFALIAGIMALAWKNSADSEIKLTNAQFDSFVESCENPKAVSPRIKDAAKLLDDEGFVLNGW